MTFDEFQERSKDWFREKGHRHVFLALYVTDDENGTMSDHYTRIYQNSDIYARIVEAIKTGVGFPEEVPEDFYLWALGFEHFFIKSN